MSHIPIAFCLLSALATLYFLALMFDKKTKEPVIRREGPRSHSDSVRLLERSRIRGGRYAQTKPVMALSGQRGSTRLMSQEGGQPPDELPEKLVECHRTQDESDKSLLLSSIAHDLKTPLTSILLAASNLRAFCRDRDEPVQDQLIAIIQDEADRLHRFIANLLDMTRLEAGVLILSNRDFVDLGDVIGAALNRADRLLASHRVVLDMAADLPILRLNPVLLEQVIFNLLDNAAKYSAEGTEVRLTAKHEAGRVCLQVLDEGEGLQSHELERIFDKFYRVERTHSSQGGTGLGLYICRGFVEMLGGTIVAGSRSNRTGAVFTITLPWLTEACSRDTRTEEVSAAGTATSATALDGVDTLAE